MVDALCSTPIGNDTTALVNLNKLFVELKKNLVSVENLNKINLKNSHVTNSHLANNKKMETPLYVDGTGRYTIPRSNTAPSLRSTKKRMNITDFDFSPASKDRRRMNQGKPKKVDIGHSSEDVVIRLDSLMGDLESSFSSFLNSGGESIVKSSIHVADDNNNNNNTVTDVDSDEIFEKSPDKYVLDNFTQYLYRKYALRTASTNATIKPIKPPRRMSDSRLNELQHRRQTRNSSSSSDSGDSLGGRYDSGMLYNISQHSTLCRRLKTLEASFGSTLKKQLHSVILKRMRDMNVAGCVYCLYALYVSWCFSKRRWISFTSLVSKYALKLSSLSLSFSRYFVTHKVSM